MLLTALRNPAGAYRRLIALAKGHYYRALYALLGRRVSIGRRFMVEGSLDIRGPGRVMIGDNVTVGMRVTPWTHSDGAVISIGDGVFLNGTRFGCAESISVGNGCILADCRIMDTDYHGVHPDHREAVKTAPIVIGDNVWITLQCVVLKGVTIARGCTVTPNSVVHGSLTAPNTIYGGNPAKPIKAIG